MVWKEQVTVSIREEFVIRAKSPNANVAALCREYGVSRNEYDERRAKNPSMELIKRVADFFEVSPSYFVADEVQAPRKPGPRSEIDKRVAEIKQLPPRQQRLLLIMLDSFLARARQA